MSFLDLMFEGLQSPSVLRLALLKTKRVNPLVFIFEGDDDFTYYEHSIKRCDFHVEYEHIVANGKKQVIGFLDELIGNKEKELLDKTYFFVDQDYDAFSFIDERVFNLDAYAIESYLIDEAAIGSILKDELKLNGEYATSRKEYLECLKKSYEDFSSVTRELCCYLCLCKILNFPQEFPNLSPHYISVAYNSTTKNKDFKLSFTNEVAQFIESEPLFYESITNLNDLKLIRGKYILWFIKKWVMAVKDDMNNKRKAEDKIKLSDDFITIRRLAQNCKINIRLNEFIQRIKNDLH